jgi:GTP pyrophosphokinase
MEIQIRTDKMHVEAEYGIASHILYKEMLDEQKLTSEDRSSFSSLLPRLFKPFSKKPAAEKLAVSQNANSVPEWIAQIGSVYSEDHHSTDNFIEDAENDFFSNRIFVFTPMGDVVDLPVGATPIDFAYSIHSEIGDQIGAAMVNRKPAQLDKELHNGDIVEIETRKSAKPTEKWLQAAKTSLAKRKIRAALEQERQTK